MENETIQPTVTEQTSEEATIGASDETSVLTDVDTTTNMSTSEVTSTVDDTADDVTPSSSAEELIFTPVYNGAVMPIKASDTDEVTTLLQLGMKQRAFLPVYEQLEQLAHESGAKSVAEFVQNAFDRNEQKYLDDAIARYGDEEGKNFYEYQKSERSKSFSRYQQQAVDAEQEARKSRNAMLADQFMEMQAEYPEYTEFKDVPKAVVQMALEKGLPLLDAMTRFKRAEDRKVQKAAEVTAKAAAAATGSMVSESDSDSLLAAFRRGLDRR